MTALQRSPWFTAVAVGAALLLSSCGLGGGSTTGEVEVGGEVKGTIRFQTMQLSPTFDKYLSGVVDAFEAAHPGTTVEWTDIPADAAARKTSADAIAGTLPDVLDLDIATLAPLGRKGLVVDMAKSASDLRGGYVASAWDSFALGDTGAAALPWYLNTPVLISNQAVLRKAGLLGSPEPTGYDDLLARSAQIAKSAGVAGFQPTGSSFSSYLLTVGAPLVDADSTKAVVNTPEAVAFVQKLAELYKTGGIPRDSITAKDRSEIETFSEGKTAYLESGGSRLKIIKENSPATFAEVAVGKPLGDATKRTWLVAHGLAVPKSSGNLPTALAFAKFLTSAENQLALAKQSSVFPSTTSSLQDPFFAIGDGDLTATARRIAAASLRDGKTIVQPPAADSEYAAALWSAVQPAILGKSSPAEALADAEAKLTKILQERQQ
ncbi:ABC transporter substrate-binding protein [Kribbella sp. CA-293567]|uniref:ABC transporter substrate-binding protein n=1 Tax=Kribbella sp. CA-293567 TaxID=3002436 RepID=UPI0022DD30A7|nr:extracellular solute-binding protein [Kribbella sp. CA-293567]WBQ06077.1 extracellular solute-binding protein [Kribbella sp. CA-293567]